MKMRTRLSEVEPFDSFVVDFSERLQRAADTYLEKFNEHEAFDYLVAELFATTKEEHFTFTDGPKDGGIDFCVRESPAYTIFQCKCPELETLQRAKKAPTFDEQAVDELISAINILKDPTGSYDISRHVKRLRADYQRDLRADPNARLLAATLALAGELTPAAGTKFHALQQKYRREGVSLRLLTWRDVDRALHYPEQTIEEMSMDLEFDNPEKDILRHHDYCYLLANASNFFDAFSKYEWNLFEWNVRLQLHKSPINKRIVACLSKERTRKRFHHYNNGILITCQNYRVDLSGKRVRVKAPQIINGCQTVRAICEAYEELDPDQQEDFRRCARVQVKIIQQTDPDFISELTVSTNDQNPMNQRNLKSNSPEQREVQQNFRGIQTPWFYERKDGEFKSLLSASAKIRWFRKSDYSANGKRFRIVSNEEIAKVWHSFTGGSGEALKGGIDYFQDEGLYSRLFKSAPNSEFWERFGQQVTPTLDEDCFDPHLPSVYQYLLAVVVARYAEARRVSFIKNKEEAIKRGVRDGKLRLDQETGRMLSSDREVDQFLADDIDYRLNIMLNNMREVLIELSSFVLTHTYGPLDAQTSRSILTSTEIIDFFRSGCDAALAPPGIQPGNAIMGPTYEFLRYCMKQYYFENRAEIEASSRLKNYLAQRKIVNSMRGSLVRESDRIAEYLPSWKPEPKPFFQSLPSLKSMSL